MDFDNFIKASKIEGCKFVTKGELPFDFQDGACNTFLEPTPRILLCFTDQSYSDSKRCHMWALNIYNETVRNLLQVLMARNILKYKSRNTLMIIRLGLGTIVKKHSQRVVCGVIVMIGILFKSKLKYSTWRHWHGTRRVSHEQ